MRLLHVGIPLLLVTAGFADTVRLKNGRVIEGTYLGGSARQVRVEVGDQIRTLDVVEIDRIEFGGQPAPPPVEAESRPVLRRNDRPDNVMRPELNPPPPPPAAPRQTEEARAPMDLPAGTNIVIRMIEGVDSENARLGQTFAASIDEPVVINGQTVLPRGNDVVVKLVDSKESGKLTGRSELTLDLQSIRVDGRLVDVNTQTVSRVSDSRGEKTAKVAGGTAAVGAIIGAIAGGGKGAAVGAAAGGAAGAGTQVITKGQRVRIPSETRLTFVLDTAVRI
jgi:hypothetical protein